MQINWHGSDPVLSLDFHRSSALLATGGADHDIKVRAFSPSPPPPPIPIIISGSSSSYDFFLSLSFAFLFCFATGSVKKFHLKVS